MQHGRSHWWEGVAIVLALVSIWPYFLGWPHPFWRVFAWTMLGLMAVVFVMRVRRVWRMGHPRRLQDR
jgi:hypothetical protein